MAWASLFLAGVLGQGYEGSGAPLREAPLFSSEILAPRRAGTTRGRYLMTNRNMATVSPSS
jgi:hypothetical protein